MIIIKEIAALQKILLSYLSGEKSIGFVPTMGALHSGHLRLVSESIHQNTCTVVSIFVNPAQFNDQKDYEKYPKTLEADIYKLEQAGTTILFLPTVEEIYPNGFETNLHYNLGKLDTLLEGFYRPGHFQGVCRVVHRLLEIVKPHHLYMGQKDYQQCMVVQWLIKEFHLPLVLHITPTERAANGLALSSRNLRLSANGLEKAVAIFNALTYIKKNLTTLPINTLKSNAISSLLEAGFDKIDYISICHATTLNEINNYETNIPTVILAAAFLENVRLIDNMLVN
ncbi:pantoate--beta-alanine ligase [Limnovirga soli]|uniref:Pantothenate synthetase n=1 Tax=Limnovirga soli TaxID=2656915 RepID=A0A8J8FMZ6_9BACT|nr:pantoate--beta-alanine ligase [Limnovirga soli]NNV57849.1 pantoate--beta-alanine ligase [Limnovirga soli]